MSKKFTEKEIVSWLSKKFLKNSTAIGIGDDCAVLNPNKQKWVWTVDRIVENVHFSLKYFNFKELGHKALAVNLSDIAAMGAKPVYGLVSLSFPKTLPLEKLKDLFSGIESVAKKYKTQIIGGNLSNSKQVVIDISLLGECKKPLLRSTAKPNDIIFITGPLGLSACGYNLLKRNIKRSEFTSLYKAQKQPLPKIELGLMLNQWKATSLIDISDGLSTELNHISEASNVGFQIDLDKIPKHPLVLKAAKLLKKDPLDLILNGGEDYELLGTMSASSFKKTRGLIAIGKITREKKKTLKARGFDHFSV